MLKIFSFFTLSLLLVAFGQPVHSPILSVFSASIGYALFWLSINQIKAKKKRFFLSFLWFSLVQSIWLSWMTSITYTSYLMLFVYFFFVLLLGVEFAIISLFIPTRKTLSKGIILFIAAFATLFEWSHLFILTGYAWNPIGLPLSANYFSLQLVSLFGVLGLSFYVVMTNLFAYRFFQNPGKKNGVVFSVIATLPYLLGALYLFLMPIQSKTDEKLSAILVQPSLYPENKEPLLDQLERFIPPLRQWQQIMQMINETKKDPVDLIVLPESAVSFQASQMVYPLHLVEKLWQIVLSEEKNSTFFQNVPLQHPFAEKRDDKWFVSNLFFAKCLANHFQTDLIIGLDDMIPNEKKAQNCAFFLQPTSDHATRYAKRMLVPLTEYFPFSFCASLAEQYGIYDAFTPGKEMRVFSSKTPIVPSICYEEIFSHQMTKAKRMGAKLLVNLSNDVWFPKSSLPIQHYSLGKLRAVENGVPILRACNTGVSAGVDSFGHEIKKTNVENRECISLMLPLHTHPTLFSFWGDVPLLLFCFVLVGYFLVTKLHLQEKLFEKKRAKSSLSSC